MRGSRIYSDEIWSNVNKKSKDILADYTLELRSKRKAKKTIEQYTYDIKAFLCWGYNHLDNASILDLKKRDFRTFFLYMDDRGCSSSRINRMQCSIRNMLSFVCEDDDDYSEYEINAMQYVRGLPKQTVREIYFLENDAIEKMVNILVERKDYQRALYLTLSYESAGRRNEINQVLKHDFLDSNRTNEVIGKRAKKFSLLYFNKSKEIAKLWLEQRGSDEIDNLFVVGVGENRRPVSYETIYDWCVSLRKVHQEVTGEFIEFNPHSFRHSSLENYGDGTHFVLKELGKDKLPIEVLKVLANHSDLSTTSNYLKDKDQQVLNEAFGL